MLCELGSLASCAPRLRRSAFPSMKWRHCVQKPHRRGGVPQGLLARAQRRYLHLGRWALFPRAFYKETTFPGLGILRRMVLSGDALIKSSRIVANWK